MGLNSLIGFLLRPSKGWDPVLIETVGRPSAGWDPGLSSFLTKAKIKIKFFLSKSGSQPALGRQVLSTASLLITHVCFILSITLLTTLSSTHPLTPQQTKQIGEQIWFNEANKQVKKLVHWSPHEAFPSLGIGHFIWLPQQSSAPYTQIFPQLCDYLKANNIILPTWLTKALADGGAPWQTREAFLQDTQKLNDLLKLLQETIHLQADFMIKQLEKDWTSIIKSALKKDKKKLTKYYALMRSTSLGTYALVDYLNFKGSGLNPKESINGVQWGLLQVMSNMPNNLTKETIMKAFANSAEQRLLLRIKEAKPKLDHVQAGWMKRIRTYENKKLFNSIMHQNLV